MADYRKGDNPVVRNPEWLKSLGRYQRISLIRGGWQLFNTFFLYILSWTVLAMNVLYYKSIWIHLFFVLIAAGLNVRIFIIFHDCCHHSFFSSRRANMIMGHITGILTFTPYESWRRSHGIHHNTASNLDKRGKGDIWTMTVAEYTSASFFRRIQYRLFRNPIVLFILGPIYIFLIDYRFPKKGDRKRQVKSLHVTNAGIFSMILVLSLLIGFKGYLLIQLPVFLISGLSGVWLFYVQHQFEGVYWARQKMWNPLKAAIKGSSYYKLPRVLQWFSGNIGFHHIHHIRPRIPNYYLPMCQDAIAPELSVPPLNLKSSLNSLKLKLWDEKAKRLVGFDAIKNKGEP